MFFKSDENSVFQCKEIKIDDLSYDFVNKEAELLSEGCYINMSTKCLIGKLEMENIKAEEYNFFLSRIADFKIFCQLIVLDYQKQVQLKLYRIILI